MCDSVRMLMADCIDYAGIFPPAKLPLADALHNYVRYARQPEAWMLGRFVCPASLLPALAAFATDLPFLPCGGRPAKNEPERIRQLVAEVLGVEVNSLPASLSANELNIPGMDSLDTVELVMELEDQFNLSISDDPVRCRQLVESLTAIRKSAKHPVAVVGTAVMNHRDFERTLRQDIQALAALRRVGEKNLHVEALELKVPPDAADSVHRVCNELVESTRKAIGEADLWPIDLYVEIPCCGQSISHVIQTILQVDQGHSTPASGLKSFVGLKIRMGSVDANLIPTALQVAQFIYECRRAEVPWKATAGLHHALTRNAGMDGALRFGFINVIAAGVLCAVHQLTPQDIVPILSETSARAFRFCDDSFGWRDLKATISQIKKTRRTSIQSFGSCSFDEPRDGLRELMLIP